MADIEGSEDESKKRSPLADARQPPSDSSRSRKVKPVEEDPTNWRQRLRVGPGRRHVGSADPRRAARSEIYRVQGLKARSSQASAGRYRQTSREGERLFGRQGFRARWAASWVQQQLPAISGSTVDNIETALIGVLDNPAGPPRLSLVLHFLQPVDAAEVKKAWPDSAEEKLSERSFFHKGDDAYFLPASAGGKIMVVAPVTEMRDIVSSDGGSVLLLSPAARDACCRTSTDRDRMLTVVASGDMLSTARGQGLLLGPAASTEERV